ncbi:hypothetical protein GCM10007880_66030 [Mesorhizobium amorphae]|nr:hypothetical protein GCM10007880_66030 [Mesorhizobium amorphae]
MTGLSWEIVATVPAAKGLVRNGSARSEQHPFGAAQAEQHRLSSARGLSNVRQDLVARPWFMRREGVRFGAKYPTLLLTGGWM